MILLMQFHGLQSLVNNGFDLLHMDFRSFFLLPLVSENFLHLKQRVEHL